MKRRRNIGEDRISELPEPIIHHIMSCLSEREAAQTSVLSKTWYRIYKTYPVLIFYFDHFIEKLKENFPEETTQFHRSLKTYRKRVYKSLRRFSRKNIYLQAFCVVNYHRYPELVSDYSSWIISALENRVQELKIVCPPPPPRGAVFYTLPQPLFSSTTLTTVSLDRCIVEQPLSVFSSLKKLTLKNCVMKGPIILIHWDCPTLEYLSLEDCEGFHSLHISNLVRLHTLVMNINGLFFDDVSVKIASKIIQKLTFRGNPTWTELVNIDGCDHLKFLHLESEEIMFQEFYSLLSKLPLLEELYVFNCERLDTIKVVSPVIKTLAVRRDHSNTFEIEIATPSLKNFFFLDHGHSKYLPTLFRDIRVANCCHGLQTLVLSSKMMNDREFCELISKFPQLENLWINGCPKLRRLEIPNLLLKTLHIARCPKLKAVKVYSQNLLEMYCTAPERLKISVAGRDGMCAGGRWLECEVDSSWEEMVKRLVKDEYVGEIITDWYCRF